ncbi:hypothetical protein GWI33_001644 [Rhynchophorus ferrugineus]|uniref:Uncharacterized protein n=1 Tax=Rhynchophorus ferrugineus TaxID=354439 RepID=A0A834MHZ1_RHYFE|nr:hypothetical protein GWI33_001644 [Rhynchophorus ferrugineus]
MPEETAMVVAMPFALASAAGAAAPLAKVAVKIRREHWSAAHETIKKNYEGRPRSRKSSQVGGTSCQDQWLRAGAIPLAKIESFIQLYLFVPMGLNRKNETTGWNKNPKELLARLISMDYV